MRTHLYQPDPDNGPDHQGRFRCLCGMPQQHRAHRLPDTPAEARELDARKLGDR